MITQGRPSRANVCLRRLEAALAELTRDSGGLPSPHEVQAIWADIWHQALLDRVAQSALASALKNSEARCRKNGCPSDLGGKVSL